MYYLRALTKTFDYIEEYLTRPFTVDDLCVNCGFSRAHFSRLFHAFTGHTLRAYVRNRRLTEAGMRLVNTDHSILDIALDYQFSSQEAFTRAFNDGFGTTPGKFRKLGQAIILQAPVNADKLVLRQGGNEVKPEIRTVGPLKLAGLLYEGNNENHELAGVWATFMKRTHELKNVIDPTSLYGMCEPVVDDLRDLDFHTFYDITYLVALEVSSDEYLPEGMTYWEIPEQKYAMFTHTGDVKTMGQTYQGIFTKWLPESGYEVVHAHDFELYNKEFRPESPDSKAYIFVPIK